MGTKPINNIVIKNKKIIEQEITPSLKSEVIFIDYNKDNNNLYSVFDNFDNPKKWLDNFYWSMKDKAYEFMILNEINYRKNKKITDAPSDKIFSYYSHFIEDLVSVGILEAKKARTRTSYSLAKEFRGFNPLDIKKILEQYIYYRQQQGRLRPRSVEQINNYFQGLNEINVFKNGVFKNNIFIYKNPPEKKTTENSIEEMNCLKKDIVFITIQNKIKNSNEVFFNSRVLNNFMKNLKQRTLEHPLEEISYSGVSIALNGYNSQNNVILSPFYITGSSKKEIIHSWDNDFPYINKKIIDNHGVNYRLWTNSNLFLTYENQNGTEEKKRIIIFTNQNKEILGYSFINEQRLTGDIKVDLETVKTIIKYGDL